MDIKILVATHKAYWMPKDTVYLPLHVGREGKQDLGFVGDNTGANISAKNTNYCELTALYWAWKNLHCEYIGLCHYRRYFARRGHGGSLQEKKAAIFTQQDYARLLRDYDVILPKKRKLYIETVRRHYECSHNKRDLDEVERVIAALYPEYSAAFTKVMQKHSLYICNMFVMKKKLFDEYAAWLFTVLFELEQRIDISSYDAYQARVFGFLSERLFNVWLEHKQLKACESDVVFLEKIDWLSKGWKFLLQRVRW